MKKLYLILALCITMILSSCSTQNEIQESALNNENIEQYVPEPKEAVDNGLAKEEEVKSKPVENSNFIGEGMSFTINGENYKFEEAPLMPQTPVPDFMTITAPDSLGIQLRMLPNEIGIYEVGKGPSDYRLVDVWFNFNGIRYVADKDKGSGIIEITKVGIMEGWNYEGEVEGTFEGTFISDSGDSIKVENGFFRSIFPN